MADLGPWPNKLLLLNQSQWKSHPVGRIRALRLRIIVLNCITIGWRLARFDEAYGLVHEVTTTACFFQSLKVSCMGTCTRCACTAIAAAPPPTKVHCAGWWKDGLFKSWNTYLLNCCTPQETPDILAGNGDLIHAWNLVFFSVAAF